MSPRKRILVASITSVFLVVAGRLALKMGGRVGIACAVATLFPGLTINLFTRGVHGSWEDPLGESITMGVSAIGWFFLIRAVLGAVCRKKGSSQEPTSPDGRSSS